MTLVNIAGITKVALTGYDPVTFFEDKPTNGSHGITSTHDGATYYFVSRKNKELFDADPDRYVPQMGGFCAYGVAKGGVFSADVATAQVYKGKLYVNLNPAMLSMFNEDLEGNIAKAEQNWEKLKNQPSSE